MFGIIAIILYTIALLIASAFYLRYRYKLGEKNSWDEIIRKNKKYVILTCAIFIGILIVEINYILNTADYSLPAIMRWITLVCGIYLLAKVDYHEKRIPNKVILTMLGARAIFLAFEILMNLEFWENALFYPIIGALIGGMFMVVAMIISRKGVGMGDVKMFIIIGAYVGSTEIMSTMFYTLLASAIGGIILLLAKKASIKDTIPMAPFAFVGVALEYILLMTKG